MKTIEINNKKYKVVNGQLKANDLMLVNNPHPDSSLKNVIRTCGGINDNGTVYPKENTFVIREWSTEWCKKVIQIG